ncbi:hypothetical protein Van01_37180 [Micromonospora andamanensis]|uniref:Uncharacterized protein n=1 Tax=Micromonospora andamanensis TaxID=1287068 RepID=A0ABQ4HXY7_9ACTN|nr:hypothetical protein Van01_37180 [Micromonospora andamanensis]
MAAGAEMAALAPAPSDMIASNEIARLSRRLPVAFLIWDYSSVVSRGLVGIYGLFRTLATEGLSTSPPAGLPQGAAECRSGAGGASVVHVS